MKSLLHPLEKTWGALLSLAAVNLGLQALLKAGELAELFFVRLERRRSEEINVAGYGPGPLVDTVLDVVKEYVRGSRDVIFL